MKRNVIVNVLRGLLLYLDQDTQIYIIPIIPDTNIIQAIIIKAYGKTSLLKDAIDAVLIL